MLGGVPKNQFSLIIKNFIDYSSFMFTYEDEKIGEWINTQIDNKIINIKKRPNKVFYLDLTSIFLNFNSELLINFSKKSSR